jgi:hypothetical protein
MEMMRPDFLPMTLISISRDRERRSFRASLCFGMCTSEIDTGSPEEGESPRLSA